MQRFNQRWWKPVRADSVNRDLKRFLFDSDGIKILLSVAVGGDESDDFATIKPRINSIFVKVASKESLSIGVVVFNGLDFLIFNIDKIIGIGNPFWIIKTIFGAKKEISVVF